MNELAEGVLDEQKGNRLHRAVTPWSPSPGRRLRIAIIGRLSPWPWGQPPDEGYLADGLEAAGAEVIRLEQGLPCYPPRVVDWALFTGHAPSHKCLQFWKGQCETVVWTLDWIPDYRERQPVIDAGREATLFVTSDAFDWRGRFGIGHHVYLPAACEGVKPPFRPRPTITCAFLGSLYNDRRRRIAEIVHRLGGEVRSRQGEWLYGLELARYVQAVKVVVGDNARNDITGYWSSRNYVIPGAGGFLLTPRVPGLSHQLKPNVHIADYRSLDDLEGTIEAWIDQEEVREKIRKVGFHHVRARHTWEARARQLVRLLRINRSAPSRALSRFHHLDQATKPNNGTAPFRRKLAIVGWATDAGVGREFTDALRHLPVNAAFVLPNSVKRTRHDLLKRATHFLSSGQDLEREMEHFLDEHKPDTILTWEVPGSWSFPEVWARKGIRWVHVVHWDCFAGGQLHLWRKAELIAPNGLCQRELASLGLGSKLLPVPVDTELFRYRPRSRAKRFISIYGYGGQANRRGLPELLDAWLRLSQTPRSQPPTLELRAQKKPEEIVAGDSPFVRIVVANPPDPSKAFERADVAVQVSRYEGIGLSLLEAQARGVPVITVDAEPMREVAPDLLVRVDRTEMVHLMGKPIVSSIASVESLCERVRVLHGSDIRDLSREARRRVEEVYSWSALGGRWKDMLTGHSS